MCNSVSKYESFDNDVGNIIIQGSLKAGEDIGTNPIYYNVVSGVYMYKSNVHCYLQILYPSEDCSIYDLIICYAGPC